MWLTILSTSAARPRRARRCEAVRVSAAGSEKFALPGVPAARFEPPRSTSGGTSGKRVRAFGSGDLPSRRTWSGIGHRQCDFTRRRRCPAGILGADSHEIRPGWHTRCRKRRCVARCKVLGLHMLRQDGWADRVAPGIELRVEVRQPATTHTVTVAQLQRWCGGIAVSPDEISKKRKMKALLG
jgi:hypothetical protein